MTIYKSEFGLASESNIPVQHEEEMSSKLSEKMEEVVQGKFLSKSSSIDSLAARQINRIAPIVMDVDTDSLVQGIQEMSGNFENNIYTSMLQDLRKNQTNPKYSSNGIKTIRAFAHFSEIIERFKNGEKESYKEIIAYVENNHFGFHEDNYLVNGKFSPEVFITSIEYTDSMLRSAYADAQKTNFLPIFFQAALSDGGCLQARSTAIENYISAISNSDEDGKDELLKIVVNIYAARYGSNVFPVDFEELKGFLLDKMSLSLEAFGIKDTNPKENEIIKKLAVQGIISLKGEEILSEVYELFSLWLCDNNTVNARSEFKKYLKMNLHNLPIDQKDNKHLEKLINQLILICPFADQYLQKKKVDPSFQREQIPPTLQREEVIQSHLREDAKHEDVTFADLFGSDDV